MSESDGGESSSSLSGTDRFAELMAAPLFVFVDDIVARDGVRQTFTCDSCKAQGIDPVVRSYVDSEQNLCHKCHNEMRTKMTDPQVVRWANDDWEKNKTSLTATAGRGRKRQKPEPMWKTVLEEMRAITEVAKAKVLEEEMKPK